MGSRKKARAQASKQLGLTGGFYRKGGVGFFGFQTGLGWWFGILGLPLSNNPFQKGIPNIQTTNPSQFLLFVFLARQTFLPGFLFFVL